ncbi:type II toxin-antitoxin system VapC family toxin [Pelotomaculum terephthalicicum JT]|uniref:type II toxin-antitoxin system VapC family toxin n=1 Tax=Pelotomaculum terephthalicicum TaxID=206393 RepID=UPI0009CCA682|nr:type II toxin-antitoxin system VapC family toxin [Pelotomaculum terephthalicicum]MCG9969611.1 type II toxin-antitoxin system VapC family toxin [Pelotomaculum terephthalicicum JT]OPX83363.1 MAG: tRNA(fMet)-specific endonuclease VapC [Pelotomaculum sp. PtaB.Bin104]
MPWKSKKRDDKVFVLDAYALLAFLEAEEGGDIVNEYFKVSGALFYVSAINMGEVFYITLRERGMETAELVESELNQAHNIRVVDATWERAKLAGIFKSRGGISFADCFAAALAFEKDVPLITGDNEFKKVDDKVKIIWLISQESY